MKAITITAFLAALPAIISAAPVAEFHVPKTTYVLQTEAVDGNKFNGLYVSTYHTYAGGNAAFLVADKGVHAYVKDEELYFALGNTKLDQYPMQLTTTDPSAAWGTTSINLDQKASKGFKMTDSGYLVIEGYPEMAYQENDKGAHWRVCEWTHGVPELFWNYPETDDNIPPKSNPATCSLVNLKMVKNT